MSSGSVNVTHSPVACSSPRLRAADWPAFAWWSTVTGNGARSRHASRTCERAVGGPVVDRHHLEHAGGRALALDRRDEVGEVARDVEHGGHDRHDRSSGARGRIGPALVDARLRIARGHRAS